MPRTKRTRTHRSSKPPVSVVEVVILDKDASIPRRGRVDKSRRSSRRPRNVVTDVALGGMATLAKAALLFGSAAVFNAMLNRENQSKSVSFVDPADCEKILTSLVSRSVPSYRSHVVFVSFQHLFRHKKSAKLHVPSGLDEHTRRALTINLGGGDCVWEVMHDVQFFSTVSTIMMWSSHSLAPHWIFYLHRHQYLISHPTLTFTRP